MAEILTKIKKSHSVIELFPLDSELKILNRILYRVCSNEIKKDVKIIDQRTGIGEDYSYTTPHQMR